jgi:hypothetical protein
VAVVTFDPAEFRVLYPAFGTLTDAQLRYAFDQACLYLNNTDASQVVDVAERKTLLYMLTAHICQLQYGANGQGASGMVGQITSATQGSVSVSVAQIDAPGTSSWFMQTQYGASYWAATARYRLARYVPPARGYPFQVHAPWRP